MLGVGAFPPPSAPPQVLNRTTTLTTTPSFSLLRHPQTLKLVRTGFSLFAQNKHQSLSLDTTKLKKSNLDDAKYDVLDIDDDDDVDDEDEYDVILEDEDFDDFDDDDDDDDVDEDDMMIPPEKMRELLKRKPKGFGEGKVYDTSVEDRLIEEIESYIKAKHASLKKLKNEPKEPTLKKGINKELKASEGASSGIRVRINNLPKKKNILRDLKSAFAGARGIINISPVVSGNKKTRDPVCRGFAFVDFKSIEDANRFVNMFSGKKFTFGKVEKQIKCDVLKPSDAGDEGSTEIRHKSSSESRSIVSEDKGDQDLDADENILEEDEDSDESDEESDNVNVVDNLKSSSLSEHHDSSGAKLKVKSTADSSSSKHKGKTEPVKKKPAGQKKPNKSPKLNISGSAKRLKVKEKAKLADVFSRYGSKEAVASKEM